MATNADQPKRFDFFALIVGTLRLISTVALCTIAGYMVVGGIVGTIAMMAGSDFVARYAPAAGWCLGAVLGVANELPRSRKKKKTTKRQPKNDNTEDDQSSRKVDNLSMSMGSRFRMPGMLDFGKSVSIATIIGLVLGLITSVFLSVVLISVTTSPFVPNSWRPETKPVEHSISDTQAERRRRDGVSTSFTHPLLGPIFLIATGSLTAIGLCVGAVTAFFPDDEQGPATADDETKQEA